MKEDKLERYDFEYPFSKCEISLQQRKSNLNTWYTALLRNTSCIFPHTLPFTLQANVVVFCLILLGFWLSKSIVFFFLNQLIQIIVLPTVYFFYEGRGSNDELYEVKMGDMKIWFLFKW